MREQKKSGSKTEEFLILMTQSFARNERKKNNNNGECKKESKFVCTWKIEWKTFAC
jgi:hypothetical protein